MGTRWRIRKKTFAHVLTIDAGRPAGYARAAATDGPATVLTFESSGPELAALSETGHPFFKPPWRPTVVGMVLDVRVDWDEVAELLTGAGCVPRRRSWSSWSSDRRADDLSPRASPFPVRKRHGARRTHR